MIRHLLRTHGPIVAAAIAFLQGCAFTPSTLDVGPSADVKVSGPLADVEKVQFSAPQLQDARPDTARIGWKKNGYGQNTADITTARPVNQIVESAVTKALVDTKHGVGADGGILVTGTVDRFWFETDMNFFTVKFIGDVQCTLDFLDAQSRQSIYKSKYAGSYAEEKAGGLDKTFASIMSKAIDKLIEDVVLDEDLAAALASRSGKVTTNAQ
jgi:uncharacterized lipoprotein YajG